MSDTISRSEMLAKPFEPIGGAQIEFQNAHSLSYIAFYLGEINQKMERIAKALEGIQLNAGSSATALKLIQTALAHR